MIMADPMISTYMTFAITYTEISYGYDAPYEDTK